MPQRRVVADGVHLDTRGVWSNLRTNPEDGASLASLNGGLISIRSSGDIDIGAGSLLGQWGRISPDTGPARTTFTVGYDYNLSKRTDVYGVFTNNQTTSLESGQTFAVGIRHNF